MWWGPATYYPTARPPQRAAAPGAVGAAAVGRPDPHPEPIRPPRLGQPGGPHRGGLDASRAGRRLATLDAPRRRGAGAGVPPQPRPAHGHRRLVLPTARQPAHRRATGGARRRTRGRRAVLRGAVVWTRSAAVGCRAGRPAWRPRGAGGPLQRRLGAVPVAGPSPASPTDRDPRQPAAAGSPAQVTTACALSRPGLPILPALPQLHSPLL